MRGQPRISGKLTGSPLRSEEGAREKTLLKLHFPKIAGRSQVEARQVPCVGQELLVLQVEYRVSLPHYKFYVILLW